MLSNIADAMEIKLWSPSISFFDDFFSKISSKHKDLTLADKSYIRNILKVKSSRLLRDFLKLHRYRNKFSFINAQTKKPTYVIETGGYLDQHAETRLIKYQPEYIGIS
jgi:hypothetical protein